MSQEASLITAARLPAPRGWQQEAIAAIAAADVARGQVVAACGTGKTLVSVHAAAKMCPTGVVVVACPSLSLLAQTLKVWLATGVRHILAVCSDDTVAEAAVHTADLGCPVTTNPREIADWLGRAPSSGLRLILTTHSSAGRAGAGLAAAGLIAHLLIVDEAHHTAGWSGKYTALVHNDADLPARRRLYMTATPRILTSRQRGNAAVDMLSMDDTAVFGPVLYRYPFAAAIADGWLDDYRVVVIGITSAEALDALSRIDDRTVVERYAAPIRTVVTQTALVRAAAEFGLRRILVFAPRIAQSREFARTLPQAVRAVSAQHRPPGHLTAVHVDGTQSAEQRAQHLARLAQPPQDGWAVLSNARCLHEGVDVPAVDAVAFAGRKKSQADVVQAVGRGLRRNPAGSGIATVLVPVLLPDDPAALHDEDHLAEWDSLLQVLRALRAHDDGMALQLDTARMNVGTGPAAALPPRILIRLPDGHRAEDLLQHVTVRVLQQATPEWLAGHAALKAFHAEHGHLRLPQDHPCYAALAQARTNHRKGLLPSDRVRALEALDVEWDPREVDWNKNFAAVQAFHAEHGHLRIPAALVVDGVCLQNWLNTQRATLRDGTMRADRLQALNTLCSDWNSKDRDRYLAAAAAFHAKHGHLGVPKSYPVDDFDLGAWIMSQRRRYRLGDLSREQTRALEALGIDWDPQAARWERGLAAAAAFQARHGHLRPPRQHRENGFDLGMWLNKQRSRHRTGTLPEHRVRALDELGVIWNPGRGDPPPP